jgi:hypothetical protein
VLINNFLIPLHQAYTLFIQSIAILQIFISLEDILECLYTYQLLLQTLFDQVNYDPDKFIDVSSRTVTPVGREKICLFKGVQSFKNKIQLGSSLGLSECMSLSISWMY